MVVITTNIVLKVYHSLLNDTLSYENADRWAWSMMQEFDNNNLAFEPIQDEDLIWELISFLYGINMPLFEKGLYKPAKTNFDVINFLKEHNVYERTLGL